MGGCECVRACVRACKSHKTAVREGDRVTEEKNRLDSIRNASEPEQSRSCRQ